MSVPSVVTVITITYEYDENGRLIKKTKRKNVMQPGWALTTGNQNLTYGYTHLNAAGEAASE